MGIETPGESVVHPIVDGMRAVLDAEQLEDLKRHTRRGMRGRIQAGISPMQRRRPTATRWCGPRWCSCSTTRLHPQGRQAHRAGQEDGGRCRCLPGHVRALQRRVQARARQGAGIRQAAQVLEAVRAAGPPMRQATAAASWASPTALSWDRAQIIGLSSVPRVPDAMQREAPHRRLGTAPHSVLAHSTSIMAHASRVF